MIVLLYCVAVLLILAGGAASLYGSDNIRAESGAAWLQTGGAVFAIGFLVLAMAAALRELRQIRRALTEIGEEPESAPAPAPRPAPPVPAAPPAAPSSFEIPPAAAALGEAADESAGEQEREKAPEAKPVKAPTPEPKVAEEAGPAAEEEPAPAAAQAPAPKPEEPPTVVATYTSGGVNYFMYSNGAIEAEMEKGRIRFGSMAELRHYVDTGEGGELIAPASGAEPEKSGPAAPAAS
ncbi:hypothetical protein SLNSH_13705 [Alsobacter soli]|uniref:DUF308 domain-containing protein n=1 Tax=Alsobacter soli TaxID=2109933 RepID=A0A2T1HSD5_9HYPH|nr:hypothetical protein [Alsobacter soli]PSC04546.1 hypothetical protein SLNSH_13705 [Alsobacter soli]